MEHTEMFSNKSMHGNYPKCTRSKKITISLYQIKTIQQDRFSSYWKQLQSQNSELINRIAEQIKQSNDQQHKKCLEGLNLLLLQPRKMRNVHSKLNHLSYVLIKMLKSTILDDLSNMPAGQREFYQEISKMNHKLIEIARKQKGNPNRYSDYTIEKLFHLDVTSLLLRQNQIFKKQLWQFENLWTKEDLQEISLLFYNTVLNVYKKHQHYSDYLRYNNNHKKINDIVTVLALVRIEAKLFYFLRQDSSQFPFLLNIENERQQRQRKIEENQSNDNQTDFRFNFCQLANFSIQNQVQQPPTNCKIQFDQTLLSIMKQPSLWGKKYLILLAKINYKVSIRSTLKSLSYLRQIDEQQLIQSLEKVVQAKQEKVRAEIMCEAYMNFQDKWRNIFLKNYTAREAFDKYGISKDFDVVISSNQNCYMGRLLRNYVFVASLGRFYYFSRNVQTIIFLQSKLRPLIAIKMYEIVYQNTKAGTVSEEKTEDYTRTLILATVNSKVLFFYLLKGEVNSYEYFRKIILGFKSNPAHSKFTAILFQLNFKQNYITFQKEYKRFVNYLTNRSDSRAYLSSDSQYCDLNLYIFAILSDQLKKISKKMTKDKFYEALEDEVTNVLTIFK